MRGISILPILLGFSVELSAASLPKARTLYENHLYDEAKKELIDVAYDERASATDKASALYLLGLINTDQGNQDVAQKTWQELAKNYPRSPEAQLVATKGDAPVRITPATAAAEAEHAVAPAGAEETKSVTLFSNGKEPRYKLAYRPGSRERGEFRMEMTMLDSDCPTEPSKKPYDVAKAKTPVEVTSTADPGGATLVVRMTGEGQFSVGDDKGSEPFKAVVRMKPSGEIVEVLEGDDSQGAQLAGVFPEVPVGLGARWEVAGNTSIEGNRLRTLTKYSILSISGSEAKLETDASMTGQSVTDEGSFTMEGGSKGISVWREGRFLPPGSSSIGFLRFIEMTGSKHDTPGHTACMLMSAETR
jgi:hypothetical protein